MSVKAVCTPRSSISVAAKILLQH